MDEYIKREDAIKHLRGACIAKYPLSFSYGIFASADEISKLPTADVVPKSESLPLDVHEALKQRAVEKAKADVAREIFAELETKAPWFCENQTAYEHFNEELAELKKKYTEGESNGSKQ